MQDRSELEKAKGCREDSKLFPVAEEIRDRYLRGESLTEIAAAYPEHGITKGMVAGFVFRNQLKRTHSEYVERKLSRLRKQSKKPSPTLPPPEERQFDIYAWDGEIVARRQTLKEVLCRLPHMSEDRFNHLLEKDRQVVTTSFMVLLSS